MGGTKLHGWAALFATLLLPQQACSRTQQRSQIAAGGRAGLAVKP